MDTTAHIYTVSEITRTIKITLEKKLQAIWLDGEISNLTRHSSGHTYFTLKDEHSQIKAVLFKSRNLTIKSSLALNNGLHIFAYGNISVYERGGNYQIIIENWEPKGLGALQLAFEELKKKLYKEGIFDPRHKKPLPLLPQLIGIITSPSGAAIRDIINILTRRFPNIGILLHPARVQGTGAAEEIAKAIDTMNTIQDIDVLIVGRGGGSLEDLWAFNEECVARSIFKSRIPVISAVGHEIDFTIADFTADVRAATPSEAAEKAIAQKKEFYSQIEFLSHKLQTTINTYLNQLHMRLEQARTSYVFKEPINTLKQYTQRLDELIHRFTQAKKHFREIQQHKLQSLENRLQSLNPKSILGRGYSITTFNRTGKIITHPKTLKSGQEINTMVTQGNFLSIVKSPRSALKKP